MSWARAPAATADMRRAANHTSVRDAITVTEADDVVGSLVTSLIASPAPRFFTRSLCRADANEYRDDCRTDPD